MSEKEQDVLQGMDNIPLNEAIHKDGLIVNVEGKVAKEKQQSGHHEHHSHHSHHSHHGHHSHHHSHRHKSKKRSGSSAKSKQRKKSFRQFVAKNRKALLCILLAVLFLVALVFAGGYLDRVLHQVDEEVSEIPQNEDGQVLIGMSLFEDEVSLSSAAVQAYMQAEEGVSVHDIYERYQGASVRLDTCKPVTLSYEIKSAPKGYEVKEAVFTVTDEDGKSYSLTKQKENEAEFINLQTGTRYTYRIEIAFTNDATSFVGGEFRTAIGPRVMKVSGVHNMRDVGGWITADGQMVKQGLLYRGSEIDGSVESDYSITKEGKDVMLNELGIKTEMDLRPVSENAHVVDELGVNVEHIHYGASMYEDVFDSKYGNKTIRRIFGDLAKKNQYPIYLHCTYGSDRTGTVCYLLGALLGVSDEDLMKDYELSALFHGYVSHDEMDAFVRRVNKLPGTTLKEKVEGYLLSIGVTQKEIDSIRSIFLD